MYSAHGIYDEYSAQKEAEAAVTGLADQIASIAITASEYSANKTINLPEHIHGEPYVLTLDSERDNVKITLKGKYSGEDISEFAMLPQLEIEREGFNANGEVSVGSVHEGMNTSSAIMVGKEGEKTVIRAVV